MKKIKENRNIIEIKEEVKVGDVILEEGDRIKVLKEFYPDDDMYYFHATIDSDYHDIDKISSYLRRVLGWDAYDEDERGPYITYSFTPKDWKKVKSFIEPLSDEVNEYSV